MSFQIPTSEHKPIGQSVIWFFVVTVIFFSDSLLAQNPLRAQSTQTQFDRNQHQQQPTSTRPQYLAQPSRHENANQYQTGMIDRLTRDRQPESTLQAAYPTSNKIAQTSFNSPLESDLQASPATLDGNALDGNTPNPTAPDKVAELNFIERDNITAEQPPADETKKPQQNLGQLISKLGMNLAFVLFLAIGGILAAKQWMKPQLKGRSRNRFLAADESAHSDSMQVLETLRIDSKTTLHLVECGNSKVLVATDAVGLKSVSLLAPSFDSAMLDQAADFETANPQTFNRTYEEAKKRDNPQTAQTAPLATPKLYQAPAPASKKTAANNSTGETPDAMDEKLIRMLLENSKKRQPTR